MSAGRTPCAYHSNIRPNSSAAVDAAWRLDRLANCRPVAFVAPNTGHRQCCQYAVVPVGAHLGHVVAQTVGRAVAVALGARLGGDSVGHLDSVVADTVGHRSVVLGARLDFGVVGTAGRHSVALGDRLDSAVVDTAGHHSVVLDVARDHLGGDCRHLGLDQLGGDHRDRAV